MERGNVAIPVLELPRDPISGQEYTFQRLRRTDVTAGTHGLHKYPAKFIPQIPKWALAFDPKTPARVIADPFCGSGTALVEAGITGAVALGQDISPLAVLLSRAKTACLVSTDAVVEKCAQRVIQGARSRYRAFQKLLQKSKGVECLGLHRTWSNWFRPQELARLIALREALDEQRDPLKTFGLAILSAVVKGSSYLNEDQIKVRFDSSKVLKDPFLSFHETFTESAKAQRAITRRTLESGGSFDIRRQSATRMFARSATVDRIITSPPYINAVDYTMTHKYNMFVLGMLEPHGFLSHSREYIGMSERAVRSRDLAQRPHAPTWQAQSTVDALWDADSPVSRNRAFVVAQYFSLMQAAFSEMNRVLKQRGLVFFVIGEANRICGINVPTADILEEIANQIGFKTELRFYHLLANRSSMRLNRADSGGSIRRETVLVLRRARP